MSSSKDLTLMEILRKISTEESARFYLEDLRWPHGPVCPHCSNNESERIHSIHENKGRKVRKGLYKCGECLQQFTVTVGTIFESSHIPLNKWLIAFYMMCASKTQISALQLQRQLEIGSYRTAWFMCHRIRFALAEPQDTLLDGYVEADETYVGGVAHGHGRAYTGNKVPVVSLVERGGRVRSQIVEKVTGDELTKILRERLSPTAHLNTDELAGYTKVGASFASHDTVKHSANEYVRHDANTGRTATTNTIEGFFGNTKMSIEGTHHGVSRKHLGLYLAEFDYKYNTRKLTDGERTSMGIKMVGGRRLKLHAKGGNLVEK